MRESDTNQPPASNPTAEPQPQQPGLSQPSPNQPGPNQPGSRLAWLQVDRGFTLIIALLVMILLTTLGLSLMFTAETDRTMSRNFSGTLQASYAAEAAAESMISQLLLDVQRDDNQWSNKYLVVCDKSAAADCATEYGVNPTTVSCYTGSSTGCVWQDDGTASGTSGYWVADLTWRPTGVPRPTFPSQVPMRLHDDLKEVLPWWSKLEVDDSDADRLNTGAAGLALTSVCLSACTTGTPSYSKNEIYITGIGESRQINFSRLTRSKNPSTRAVSIRLKGSALYLRENALVGGTANGTSNTTVIDGDYLIRGSVLMFNEQPTNTVLTFQDAGTGIVNNYYDTGTGSPATIDPWWWMNARNCATAECDANNTIVGFGVRDTDSNSATATVEPIGRRLPDAPDLVTTDIKPGGYRAAQSANFPGPEGLKSSIRLYRGNIALGSGTLGVTEDNESSPPLPGHVWDNVIDIYMDDNITGSTSNVKRTNGAAFDATGKTDGFDLDPATLKFPRLTDSYVEPTTRELYTSYYDFLRPATPTNAHPGGWALNLSGIDGNHGTITRSVVDADLGGASCWPRGGGTPSPTSAQLVAAFEEINAVNGKRLRPTTCTGPTSGGAWVRYVVDTGASTTCGKTTWGDCGVATATSCNVRMICTTSNPAFCGTANCPTNFDFQIYRRKAHTIAGDSTINLDTSSSIDAPAGRAQSTMFDSFAYKLYTDVINAVNGCTPTLSTLYNNNLVGMPSTFNSLIPTNSYEAPAAGIDGCAWNSTNPNRIEACFAERSSYMDVHIQLGDVPNHNYNYTASGRWLSVRFRPTGNPSSLPTMEVLSDPRTGTSKNNYTTICGATTAPMTDFVDEVVEVEGGTKRRIQSAFPNWAGLGIPQAYTRAKPVDPNDTMFRDMPTGAFVVGLHLPCTTDLSASNKNPYKCNRKDTGPYTAPTIAYEGMMTHMIAWAPKYSCWRSAAGTIVKTISTGTDPNSLGMGPPNTAPGAACGVCPSTTNNAVGWFMQTLWQTNMTTLLNDPPIYGNATLDGGSKVDTAIASGLGFRLNVPFSTTDDTNPCSIGLDKRHVFFRSAFGTGFQAANPRMDGQMCGASDCVSSGCYQPFGVGARGASHGVGNSDPACPNSAAGRTEYCLTTMERNCYDGIDNDGDSYIDSADFDCNCTNEPDFVPRTSGTTADGIAFGGASEIFTPLVNRRIQQLDPDNTTNGLAAFQRATTNTRTPGPGASATVDDETSNCTIAGSGCYYQGVDPDRVASWAPPTLTPGGLDRYVREWPGWASTATLMGAGLVYTTDSIVFGAPKKACVNAKYCAANPTGTYASYNAEGTFATPETGARRGYFSDPIIYDGRLVLYAGADSTTDSTTRIKFHDHVVPRAQMGCSDLLSVLTTGRTEIDMQMPFDATTVATGKRHLLALYSQSEDALNVTTGLSSGIQTELVGSWLADLADFGNRDVPVQIIGTPSIISQGCDNVYLPARDALVQAEILSYVEDETLPYGY